MSRINYNYSLSGIATSDIALFAEPIAAAHEKLHSGEMEYSGWVDYPYLITNEMLKNINDTAQEIKSKCTALVVIGIGGSYLGAKACTEMLLSDFIDRKGSPKIYYAGWNMSAVYHASLLNKLTGEDVCICVVSKSGTTMETASAFKLFKYFLFEKYGSSYTDRIYAVTDESTGALRAEANSEGYKTFVLERAIGGRYSVLTPAGLLPLAVCGIDINKIVRGAQRAYDALDTPSIGKNQAYQYAVVRRLLASSGKCTEIFGFYEPQLEFFGEWLKQLFGESEGKEGKGAFPASIILTRDLHSLGQYLQQGKPMFYESMFKVAHPLLDVSFEEGSMSYNEMNDLVFDAVNKAHADASTPINKFEITDLSEETFGEMVYFFEKACAVSCILTGVNPFNQPGVEVYKQKVRELVGEKTQ